MKRILFALIVAFLCISPAFAYYTYQSNYSVPLGSSICIPSNYNGGGNRFLCSMVYKRLMGPRKSSKPRL